MGTAQLNCTFAFAYAKCRFSHDASQMVHSMICNPSTHFYFFRKAIARDYLCLHYCGFDDLQLCSAVLPFPP